jgi:FAD-dependent urate hydroxylase
MTTALVAGAGIAGPVAAMALQRAGIDVTVYEARPEDAPETGTWLTIASNGMAALAAIDAHRIVADIGFPTPANRMHSWLGTPLRTFKIGGPLDDGTLSHTVKRPTIARVLGEAAEARGITIHRGQRLVRTSVAPNGRAVAEFADGTIVEADLLVGADGLRSVLRQDLDPNAPPPRYVDMVNYGGYVPGPEAADLDCDEPGVWHMTYGHRAFFGYVQDPQTRGVVWFANVPGPAVPRDARATTTEAEWRRLLVDMFRDDSGPAAALVMRGELEVAGDNVFDHPSTPRWHDSCRVVIGDAAHAPSSISGQGAGLALEDAVVLAKCVRDIPDLARALDAYEALRRPRVERMVDQVTHGLSNKVPGRIAYGSHPVWNRMIARSTALRAFDARLRDVALRVFYRWFSTQDSLAWSYGYVLRWDDTTEAPSPLALAL